MTGSLCSGDVMGKDPERDGQAGAYEGAGFG